VGNQIGRSLHFFLRKMKYSLASVRYACAMNKLFKIITITALAAVATYTAVAYGDSGDSHEKTTIKKEAFPDVSHSDLKAMIEEGSVFLIDVNGSKSYEKGRIPGAVDFAKVKGDIASVLPKDKHATIVAYCGGPSCAAYKKAAKLVASMGYTDVHHYSGGISGWKSAGETVEKG